jgi:hypothetical protein
VGYKASAYVATLAGSRPSTLAGRPPESSIVPTGFGAAESSLGVCRNGTIFFSPAFTAAGVGVARSRDGGASWTPLVPELPGGERHGRMQPRLFVDPSTERLFFQTALLSFRPPRLHPRRHRGYHLSYSDDHGDSWQYVKIAEEAVDWGKLFAAPPVKSAPRGYPNVLYFAAPSPVSTPFAGVLVPDHQSIRRSLDGGRTWDRVGRISLRPRDVPGCHNLEWIIFGNGVSGPDGTIHLGLRRGPRLGVATSRDEGESWVVRDVPGSKLVRFRQLAQILFDPNFVLGEILATDPQGNLYALWPNADARLRFAVSRDGGDTWSEPVVVSAPQVKRVCCASVTAKAPGTVAIAYYGTSDGKRYDGYIAESTNALDREPSFWSATANAPDDPLYPHGFDGGYPTMLLGSDLDEFIQVKYAQNGDILSSFCKRTTRPASDGRSKLSGFVGRLTHPDSKTPNA